MIVIDLGNKYSTISDSKNKITLPTTLMFDEDKVKIGCKQDEAKVIFDFVIDLGLKYHEATFNDGMKYYDFDFCKGSNDKIQVIIPSGQTLKPIRKMYIETIVAIFIRQLIKNFQTHYYQIQDKNKVGISINGGSNHPYRFAIKQSLSLLKINPIILSSCHSKMLSYYMQVKDSMKKSQKVGYIQIGDQNGTICVYKIYTHLQGIVEVLDTQKIEIGGNFLTKVLCQYILKKIKVEKGIDIKKYSNFMNILHNECENVKKILSDDDEAFIRIPDLPNNSTFGKVVTKDILTQLLQPYLKTMIKKIETVMKKYPSIKTILLLGGTSKIPYLYNGLEQQYGERIQRVNLECQGSILASSSEVKLIDTGRQSYDVHGEQGYSQRFINKGQLIPMRKVQKVKFPAAQLQFNMKVFENKQKVCMFTLENRPSQNIFNLSFEIDRNNLIEIVVSTSKGKIQLKRDMQSLSKEEWEKEKQKIQLIC